MEIKTGVYMTRDGRKAEVVGLSYLNDVYIGFIDSVVCIWNRDGTCNDGNGLSHNDLIAPWEEPKKKKVMYQALLHSNLKDMPNYSISECYFENEEGASKFYSDFITKKFIRLIKEYPIEVEE